VPSPGFDLARIRSRPSRTTRKEHIAWYGGIGHGEHPATESIFRLRGRKRIVLADKAIYRGRSTRAAFALTGLPVEKGEQAHFLRLRIWAGFERAPVIRMRAIQLGRTSQGNCSWPLGGGKRSCYRAVGDAGAVGGRRNHRRGMTRNRDRRSRGGGDGVLRKNGQWSQKEYRRCNCVEEPHKAPPVVRDRT